MRSVHTILAVLVLLARPAVADESTGSIHGVVTDKSGGEALAGVSVTVASEDGSLTMSTQRDGSYRTKGLAPGRYTVLFVYGKTKQQRVVELAPGVTVRVNVTIDTQKGVQVIKIRVKEPVPPKPLKKYGATPPPYSDEAIDSDVWARAWLLLDIDTKGRVSKVKILKKAGHGLDRIGVREAKKYRFKPARDGSGRAIASQLVVPMEWPSYWRARTLISTGVPPCAGSGPMNLGSMHPTYRDCSVPDELPPGVPILEPADPPVQFMPF